MTFQNLFARRLIAGTAALALGCLVLSQGALAESYFQCKKDYTACMKYIDQYKDTTEYYNKGSKDCFNRYDSCMKTATASDLVQDNPSRQVPDGPLQTFDQDLAID